MNDVSDMQQPAPAITEHELDREALRIFRRLSKKGFRLVEIADTRKRELYCVCSARSAAGRSSLKVEGRFVREFLGRGWLEWEGEHYLLSRDGMSWFRRNSANRDSFLQQHQLRSEKSVTLDNGVIQSAIVNEGETPLCWLLKRKDRNGKPLIAPYHFEAGERLRRDFWRSRMMPCVTSNWSMIVSSKRMRRSAPDSGAGLSDSAIAAKKRLIDALASVGPELSGILIDVCCHLQGLEVTEEGQGWPQRSGKIVLQLALTRLARHYGLISEEQASDPVRSKILHWGADDFRPLLDKWR